MATMISPILNASNNGGNDFFMMNFDCVLLYCVRDRIAGRRGGQTLRFRQYTAAARLLYRQDGKTRTLDP